MGINGLVLIFFSCSWSYRPLLFHNWSVVILIKETSETKYFGFREKIARRFKKKKYVNNYFSHMFHLANSARLAFLPHLKKIES